MDFKGKTHDLKDILTCSKQYIPQWASAALSRNLE